jgi:glucose/arabinose dehydrogenase
VQTGAVRRALCLVLCAAGLTIAGCSAGSGDNPDFQPSPNAAPGVEGSGGVHVQPIIPVPSLSGTAGPGAPGSSSGTPSPGSSSSSAKSKQDPLVVATHLVTPVGLSLLPDGSALVGERTTGRIVQVQPEAGLPVPTVRTLTGLDTHGDGGLLDLAVSPTYVEDNLIYAYITTPTDNRVVDFTLKGPVTPVITGIPKGRTDNSGRIAFAANGDLYIGTGDTGRPQLAANPRSLAGKVLRVDGIGSPAKGNPRPRSPVFTSGQHVVNGLCAVPDTTTVFDIEPDAGSGDPARTEVNVLAKGANYGWPAPSAASHPALATPPSPYQSAGGCAVESGRIWVASLSGDALISASLSGIPNAPKVGAFVPVLKNRYGRLRTVVAAPDGALWLTTSNRDGHGKPVAADERVIRYLPQSGGGVGQTT